MITILKRSFLVGMLVVCQQMGYAQQRKDLQVINKFDIQVVPSAVSSNDSIRIITLLEIPYSSLQFIKDTSGFKAEYEATIVIQDENHYQYDRVIWQESITVANYIETIAIKNYVSHGKEIVVPLTDLNIVAEITDLETHNNGIRTIPFSLDFDSTTPFLLDPVILTGKPGDWGFGPNLFPLFNSSYSALPESLFVFITGYIKPEAYDLRFSLEYGDQEVWDSNLHLENDKTWFSKTVYIPSDSITGIRMQLNTEIQQSGSSDKKAIDVKLKHQGVSRFVTDIDVALDQMRYILNNDEKQQLKRTNSREKENLFYHFWRDRDPTPATIFNELMEEYYRRVNFSNEHFSTLQPGWRTDMGMIYIYMGPPDDVERLTMPNSRNSYEIWYYHRINERFTFIDPNGFGDYRLNEPFLGTPNSGW